MGKIPAGYVEKVYAGWLGKIIGVRYGAPIETWTYERIAQVYGELDGYFVPMVKRFAADDDTNGPLFFLRALTDSGRLRDITARDIGLAWLNYPPCEHGFYWWGGYGRSTEHTAYLNLRNGIMAPHSGSIEQNSQTVAEQIGGQIFIDTWGLVCPGDPALAAEFAEKAASVGHGGNGVYGGQFVAACIAAAFTETDITAVIEAGLGQIPPGSTYAAVAREVIAFHQEHPDDWRACFAYVQANHGYDRYPGNCHIIPNAAVILLSLLYGGGDFDRSLNICNMCGWDTDCNVANVGTILGVLRGLDGIDYRKWRQPINDFIVFSSVLGGMNLSDIPSGAAYIAGLGYKIAGETPPEGWRAVLEAEDAWCHFRFPGSTHAFEAAAGQEETLEASLRQHLVDGRPALAVAAKPLTAGVPLRVFRRSYLRPADFHDSRYDPSFSPTVYPGDTLRCAVMVPEGSGNEWQAFLYVRDGNSGVFYMGENVALAAGRWTELGYTIPYLEGACLEEAGVQFVPVHGRGGLVFSGYLTDFRVESRPDYTVDFALERMERWTVMHTEVSQFSYLKGLWTLEEGRLSGHCTDCGEAYTGLPAWRDYTVALDLTPRLGPVHRLLFRVQGAIRGYAAALTPEGLALQKNSNGYQTLAAAPLAWAPGDTLRLEATVRGGQITLRCGDAVIAYEDRDAPYLNGCVGVGIDGGAHCCFTGLRVQAL